MAPPFIADDIQRVVDLDCRRRLRSVSTAVLVVPPTRSYTVDDRALPVAAARNWKTVYHLLFRHHPP